MSIPRYSMVLGRLVAEAARGHPRVGDRADRGAVRHLDRERVLGFILLIALSALWGVVYAGFMQLIALKTRSEAATNSAG